MFKLWKKYGHKAYILVHTKYCTVGWNISLDKRESPFLFTSIIIYPTDHPLFNILPLIYWLSSCPSDQMTNCPTVQVSE